MSTLEFQPWPKIARLNRDITITEKIDGTNAAVVIHPAVKNVGLGAGEASLRASRGEEFLSFNPAARDFEQSNVIAFIPGEENDFVGHLVFAQSRTRFITPQQDNYGFAGWVARNAQNLVEVLGAGTHFGEWWGSGIQRKYGLTGSDKRFSLFNTARWADTMDRDGYRYIADTHPAAFAAIPELHHVPVLYRGGFSEESIIDAEEGLRTYGSAAAPGFTRPEGLVVWHDAARQSFKVTLEGDEAPKGPEAHRNDEERIAA